MHAPAVVALALAAAATAVDDAKPLHRVAGRALFWIAEFHRAPMRSKKVRTPRRSHVHTAKSAVPSAKTNIPKNTHTGDPHATIAAPIGIFNIDNASARFIWLVLCSIAAIGWECVGLLNICRCSGGTARKNRYSAVPCSPPATIHRHAWPTPQRVGQRASCPISANRASYASNRRRRTAISASLSSTRVCKIAHSRAVDDLDLPGCPT
jgi:hypothetical protein